MTALRIFAGIGTFCVCFFVYGGGRTMSEEFGFSIHGMGFGLLLSGLALVPILAVWVFLCLRRKSKPSVLIVLALILAAFMGCVFGELQTLADEVRFAKEATDAKTPSYSRPRQWPHNAAGLVYSADRGFWSTD